MINGDEYYFLCLLTVCGSPLVRHRFLSFVHFKILCFLTAEFTISLKIWGKIVISNMYFASISPSTTCCKIYPFPLGCPHTFVGISWLRLCGSVYGLSICFNWSLSILLSWFLSPWFVVYCVEKAMAPHSSTLAWKIPWAEEPGRLQSMGSIRVGHNWATSLSLFTVMHWRRKWQPTPVFLPGESQGRGSLVGCRLWGRTESDTTEVT